MSAAFDEIAAFLADRIGLAIDARRQSAIETRMRTLMAEYGVDDMKEFARRLKAGDDPGLMIRAIDAAVTCETLFFRDRAPFLALRELVLPRLNDRRRDMRALRVWSAACATGQEPYSVAMILDEMARVFAGWRTDLVASDVSRAALETAKAGLYSQFEVQRGLPTSLLLRYFRREPDGWRVAEHLRAAIDFRCVNLVSDFTRLGGFDVILCRNALMYMDLERRRDILRRLAGQLSPDGFLLLGATETVVGLTDDFAPTPGYPGVFTRRGAQARPARPGIRLVAAS